MLMSLAPDVRAENLNLIITRKLKAKNIFTSFHKVQVLMFVFFTFKIPLNMCMWSFTREDLEAVPFGQHQHKNNHPLRLSALRVRVLKQ